MPKTHSSKSTTKQTVKMELEKLIPYLEKNLKKRNIYWIVVLKLYLFFIVLHGFTTIAEFNAVRVKSVFYKIEKRE